jgi:eukaryotic-like serine/threonine-protein kinase
MIGTKLAHFTITGYLGSGGMGEVYQATDAKLGRSVAIKLLPEAFAQDTERAARFEREARVLASLNHPNIAAIYGIEQSGARRFLVMELVPGETLAERIKRGPIPIDDALEIAKQIAEALEAAHEQRVIHRDLKPANVKITPQGNVKVLDFGLAKVREAQQANATLSNLPTLLSGSASGMILGTAAYMSPEQAKGKETNRTGDVWAFGCVLYEMLTGHAAFDGETVGEIHAGVLKADPDWNRLPAATPGAIRRMLRRALKKDPRQRLGDIRDARIEIEERGTEAEVEGWMRSGRSVSEALSVTLTIVPPSGTQLAAVGGQGSAPQISPDGLAVLYMAGDAGRLYVRRLDSLEPKLVPDSRAWAGAFWSADSTTVVYPVRGQLFKVHLPDGAPQRITQLPGPSRQGSWSDGGTILIASGGLVTVSASGGRVKEVEVLGLKPGRYLNPEFLPESEDFLFLFVPTDDHDDTGVYIATLQDGKAADSVLLLKNPTAARYTLAGGGRLLFVRNDNLYSQKLNRSARKLEGEAELVVRGVASRPGGDPNCADFSVARNGTVAWRPGKAALSQVTTFDRQGNQVGATGPPGPILSLFLSPDDTRILAAGGRAWILDADQPGRQALSSDTYWFGWSRDGSKVLGLSARGNLVEFSANGSGEVRDLGGMKVTGIPHDVSPDGKQVLSMVAGARGIFVTRLEGTEEERTSRVLVQLEERTSSPKLSPDGQWIVYESDGLFVQPFPGPGRRQQVTRFGLHPEWSKDGEELIYLGPEGVMAVAVKPAGSQLHFGAPQKLFSGLLEPAGLTMADRPLAVSRDGSRFYWPQAVEQPGSNVIHIKIGWPK